MFREIGTSIAHFDELDEARLARSDGSYAHRLTPVPLSTTSGREGSIVSQNKRL